MREAVGVFDVSHLGKAVGARARARRTSSTRRSQRPAPHRPRPGAVHAVLRRRDRRRRRRPDRLPALATTRCSSSPTPRTPPRWCAGWPRRARRASRSTTCTRLRRARRAGPAQRRGARRLGLPGRPRLHVVRRDRLAGAAGRRLPHRLHRRARLRAAAALGRRRRALGRPARGRRGRAASGLRARRPRHAAHRDGLPAARPGAVARDHAGAGPRAAGRSAGRSRRSGAATRCSPRRRPAPPRLLWGLEALDRGIPRAHMAVSTRTAAPVGEVTSGTFSPTRAGHRARAARPRRWPRATRWASTSAAGRRGSGWSSRRSSSRRRSAS